ncbi:MAG TPA: hypothetical protein VGX48_12395 [Pyrinomonadaceae bacterium]|jgi:cytoskeletal protein RodZ|nr:hypothetical protein [Pyrinomonadaceae bacterium]
MPPPVLLVIIFWAVVPGLLAGWMMRERGKKFAAGLLLGFFLGPLGVLAALTYIYFDERRHGGRHERAFRVFYHLPLVGRLHVSTVWALAGVLTFVCIWALGGLWFELNRGEQPGEQGREAASNAGGARTSAPSGSQAGPADDARKAEAASKGSASPAPPSHLIGGLTGQPGQSSTQGASGQERATAQNTLAPLPPDPYPSAPSGQAQPSVAAPPPSPAPTQSGPAPAQPAAPPAHAREAAVAEATRALGSAGHRVHASLSGDAQTATLSLSGATLTRGAGNQLLGGRVRQSLKAAGVRYVVMVNGQESWTYIL